MIISNDAGSLDSGKFLDYIKKSLSADVAQLVAVKDELAKRQGALSVVEATLKAKDEADKYAASKKADADALLAKAKDAKATAEALVAELKVAGVDLENRVALNDAELAQREKDVATREKKAQANANALDIRSGELKLASETLDAATATLEARIKAFQDSIKNI